MEKNIVGRAAEKKQLKRLKESCEAEFLAIYGRRRVGKTFLVKEYFEGENIYFELTGEKDAGLADQLVNFRHAFSSTFPESSISSRPKSWREALRCLGATIDKLPGAEQGKMVLFFDELPWLASPKSSFLQALDHFWNSWACRQKNMILVVCGSAASWMITKLLFHKGGLHNRVTAQIRLQPFTLAETAQYLRSRNVYLKPRDIVELYMCVGGIPLYLRHLERGCSVAQYIDSLCFTRDGFLRMEFDRLYASLFDNAEKHLSVIKALAKKRKGLTRNELLAITGERSGGGLTTILKELEESSFISIAPTYGKRKKDALIRLIDEYSLFYLSWISGAPAEATAGYWLDKRRSPAWSSWAGFSFEGLCLKHVDQLKAELGIRGVGSVQSGWFCRTDKAGAQIDLVIDRNDNCINLCEMKYSDNEFVISKQYSRQLQKKCDLFRQSTRTRKNIFLVLVTTHGVKKNRHYDETVAADVTMDCLFKS